MTGSGSQIEFLSDGEGLIIFSQDEDLEEFDNCDGFSVSKVSPQVLFRAQNVFSTFSEFQVRSSRYVKLSPESAKLMRQRVTKGPVRGAFRRGDFNLVGNPGQFFRQIEIRSTGTLAPAFVTAGASLIAQATIEAKLDTLLRQSKVESLGELEGISNALKEVEDYYRTNNSVSVTKWLTISHLGASLHTMETTALEQISSLVEQLAAGQGNSKKTAESFQSLDENLSFWLGNLGWSIWLHDRFYVLEIAHAQEFEPDHFDGYHASIQRTRQERIESVACRLLRMNDSIRATANLGNSVWATHYQRTRKIIEAANRAESSIQRFALHVNLSFEEKSELQIRGWKESVSGFVGDSVQAVNQSRQRGVEQIQKTGERLRTYREDRTLAKADKIRARRNANNNPPDSP
ncbi:hypothetical protein [uncultured Actinomyces sp.]|uniref:hypothetical protein n=1 Tax=uncultured Actinomyces sp. TaxID=249061 RepID=UPI00288B4227|nr:hypothetical protein [uncultured Actinomyces sp.]